MTLLVRSARLGYAGADALDVTRQHGREGLFLAPSWAVLGPALRARERLAQVEAEPLFAEPALVAAVRADWDAAWERYVPAFLAEMRVSYREQRPAWEALLARKSVTICCTCSNAEAAAGRCHRVLLRERVLPKLGARDGGELT